MKRQAKKSKSKAKPAAKAKAKPRAAAKAKRKPTVCVIGIWHLGAVNAAGFAEKGYRVIGLELDGQSAQRLEKGVPPLSSQGWRS